MEENENELTPDLENNSSNKEGLGKKAANKGKEFAQEQLKKKAKEKMTKKAATQVAAKGGFAALGPILFWAAVIILAIIIIVGIIMFFVTMPGMVMDKLKELGKAIARGLSSWFGFDDTEQIEEESIYASLDYLEEMGYDVKGYGFLTDYKTEEDYNKLKKDKDDIELDAKTGVIRDGSGKIVAASSDYITAYLISDNYTYTIANKNLVTGRSDANWLEWLWDRVQAVGINIAHFFSGSYGEKWTEGLINLYYEKDGILGNRGSYYGTGGLFNYDELEMDVENKTMTLGRSRAFDYNRPMTYHLDGWTGRYGMPIDFLISMHIATMMPDLSYQMSNHFKTRINILLHEAKTSVGVFYKDNAGNYLKTSELEEEYNPKKWLDWFSDKLEAPEEAARVITEFGMSTGCDCISTGKACDECIKLLEEVISEGHTAGSGEYKYYIPYIESVENHWYRDTYFVSKNPKDKNEVLDFVTTDYDYEVLMKERWTLYELDEKNNIKLFLANKNGEYVTTATYNDYINDEKPDVTNVEQDGDYYVYKGKLEDGKKQGLMLVKKAITENNSNEEFFKDLEWVKNSVGTWVAYDFGADNDKKDSKEQLYTDEDGDTVKSKIYININNPKDVIQVGEGLRLETNSAIKKMFLGNTYLRYTGDTNSAETITKIRKAIKKEIGDDGIEYGPLNEIKDGNEYKDFTQKALSPDNTLVHVDENIRKNDDYIKIEDYSGKVVINQDSLNAFTMLENTHTLDADYIYRDFKELVVELGYFEKEELTDETPRVLEFLVPQIDSREFPNRTIDKRENEHGTMIHSNGDVKANMKLALSAAIEEAIKAENESKSDPASATVGTSFADVMKSLDVNFDSSNFVLLGSPGVGTRTLLSLEEWWEECDKMMNVFTKEKWKYGNGHNSETRGSFEKAVEQGGRYTDCSEFASWALQKLGALDEGDVFVSRLANKSGLKTEAITNKLIDEAGAEVILFGGKAIGDEKLLKPGDVIFYEGHVSIYYGDGKCYDAGTDYWNSQTEPVDYGSLLTREANLLIRFNLGSEGSFSGYYGNESVVSPVTGILLEYGKYVDGDIDSLYNKEYRVNVDLKYGTLSNVGDSNFVSEEVSDKLGYAKILVLDDENYLKLESTLGTDQNNRWKYNSLLDANGKYREELVSDKDKTALKKFQELEEVEKHIYGYKEFAELYKKSGISGYVVYIDGFICELPDDELIDTPSRDLLNSLPNGEDIDFSYFKKTTGAKLSSGEKTYGPRSFYIPDDRFKVASRSVTERLVAEIGSKRKAISGLYLEEEDLVYIKEGTVLGRTMTDRELLEVVRANEHGTIEEKRPSFFDISTEMPGAVIGNYLRIIMRDLDGTPVENVEDYMKLREAKKANDYDVHDTTLFVTKEEFLKMFGNRENLRKNVDAFIAIQEKYQVNAVFAACVTIVESSAGTGWDLIDPSTYNWVSIKGGSVDKGTGYEDRLGNVWRIFDSFSDAIYGLGGLISNPSGHYYGKNKYFVSEIGPTYCSENWAISVNRHMDAAYDRLYMSD